MSFLLKLLLIFPVPWVLLVRKSDIYFPFYSSWSSIYMKVSLFFPSKLCSCSFLRSCGNVIDLVGVSSSSISSFSPELSFCDYYSFPIRNKCLATKRFQSNEDVFGETNACFARLNQSYHLKGINKLGQC